jgi:hypothetical protein
MLTENHITQLLANHLISKGFVIKQQLTTRQKGVDLIAQCTNGRMHYIEVKGETSARDGSARFGLPFKSSQIWSHVSVALLKTLSVINEFPGEANHFGMAFPENHRELLMSIKPSLDKLGLTVYLISENNVDIL